jgi:succinylglutamate desuccinylase
MTSSAESLLQDFLGYTLALARPANAQAARGACARGARWQWLDDGVLQIEPARVDAQMRSVLLSAGIHGDETAPVELLSRHVADIAAGRAALACHRLVVLGNVGAMRAGQRYLDDDLNRLFCGAHERVSARERERNGASAEAPRAAALEAHTQRFFEAASSAPNARWHLDMHTAIRASAFEQFALVPHTVAPPSRALFAWIADARIPCVLMHTEQGVTYTSLTAGRCGATACTLELGKVRPFGHNDLTRFSGADAAVRRLVAGEAPDARAAMPRVFTVIGQITKQSDAFELHVAADVPNFTPFARGTLLANDGDYRYVVGHDEERIVFPNPGVKPGLRAGLLVVETSGATLAALA